MAKANAYTRRPCSRIILESIDNFCLAMLDWEHQKQPVLIPKRPTGAKLTKEIFYLTIHITLSAIIDYRRFCVALIGTSLLSKLCMPFCSYGQVFWILFLKILVLGTEMFVKSKQG